MQLKSIPDEPCRCQKCNWSGTVDDCIPDIDGEGSLGCPKCGSMVVVVMPAPKPAEQG